MNGVPLGYLTSSGMRAAAIVPLTWFMLVVSILVCCIVAVLLWLGLRRMSHGEARTIAVERGVSGLDWIKWGLIISTVPLLIALVWTMAALARVVGPPQGSSLTIDVTPHQYWWEVRYDGSGPADSFLTANEIHIPTGTKLLVRLHGADVIHSFWVPQLSGKTDVIPGQTNLAWMEADAPGRYRGQCAEFCGLEHAKMAFEVVAEPPRTFQLWRQKQLQAATPLLSASGQQGFQVFRQHCASCHTVRGTPASARSGPDLTHLMSRQLIAAGMLPTTRGSLAGWVQSPQTTKPGALMPDQKLTGQQLNQVVDYLETLQ